MKLILTSLATLLFYLLSMAGLYAMDLPELQQRFSQYPVIKADFEQQKQISGLTTPLLSRGQMILDRQRGLWWQQTQPFRQTLKLNQTRMELQMAGQSPQIITRETQPQLFQFNQLLTAIFNADTATLMENFSLHFSQSQSTQWQLELTPTVEPLTKIFKQIRVSGEQFLQRIELDDQQGDKTILRFSHHDTSPLTTQQQQLFESW